MKKAMFIAALAAVALSGNAQVLKSNLLDGYKEGDALEKLVYDDYRAAIQADTWCGAFTNKPNESISGPTIGKELTYEGYAEKGPSIRIGFFDEGVKGSRFTVYSLTNKNTYSKGTLYLSALAEFSDVNSGNLCEFLGLNPNHVGGDIQNRGSIYVGRQGSDQIRFAVTLMKLRTEVAKGYDYDRPHLLVLKLDYTNNQVSLFVDPKLGDTEPTPDAVVSGDDSNQLKAGIRAISIRARHECNGYIGNLRLSDSWAGVVAK